MQTQSNDNAIFDGNILKPNFSMSLDPGCMMHGFAPVDEPNADETLSFSMASTSFFPDMESGMLDDISGFQAPCTAIEEEEAVSMSGFTALNFLDVAAPYQESLTMFNLSNWPAYMDYAPLSSYSPLYGLGENSGTILPYPLASLQNSGCYSQNCTSNSVEGPGDLENTLIGTFSSKPPGLRDIISSTSKFLYGYRTPTTTHSTPTPLPNPYINSLNYTETAIILAMFHNARCVGLEIQDLMHKSPFYRPNTTMVDDPQALLAAARKPWIPIHLQPTLPQILIPHHPYLDLLPFPALRDRIITLAATAPQLFHPMDLKKDILRGGLYCNRLCPQPGGRQPWDMRSWEVAPWFLRKWRLLID